MKHNINKPVENIVIISAELSTLSFSENENRTNELMKKLNAACIKYKSVIGCYKGSVEISFVCIADGNLGILLKLAKEYKQESILVRNENGVHLQYADGFQERIGEKIVMVSQAEAMSQDAYTATNGLYYIVK